MSNRIIRESILTDKTYNALTFMEESLYCRLIVSADDYGIYYADPQLLFSLLFSRKPGMTVDAVREGLMHLEDLFIRRFTVKEEEYLQLCTWTQEQRIRITRHKFPMPEMAGKNETTPETEPEAQKPAVVELPLDDNTAYGVTQAELDEYAALYPAVDVAQELCNMRGWCLSNPRKRKTRSGVKHFISSWLARVQKQNGNTAIPPVSASPAPVPVNPFLEKLKACEARMPVAETEAAMDSGAYF